MVSPIIAISSLADKAMSWFTWSVAPSFVIARSHYPPVVARSDSDEATSTIIRLMNRQYYVYIMTSKRNTILYVGVTSNLVKMVYQHKAKLTDGFTKNYSIVKLVYREIFQHIDNAISREKQIKAASSQERGRLIDGANREWRDLYDEL